jgi:secondary thiamine-phosphate synthase enzyme
VVITFTNDIATKGQGDVRDVTEAVAGALQASGCAAGCITVFVVGSTAGVTTMEFEPGAVMDLKEVLDRLAPRHAHYHHHQTWGDDNGSSHVRAALLGPSLTLPFADKRLLLGTWQQVVLVECDTRPRNRQLVVQVMGE